MKGAMKGAMTAAVAGAASILVVALAPFALEGSEAIETGASPAPAASTGDGEVSREETLTKGSAVADMEAAAMQGVVRPTTPQTQDGAVSAATSFIGWFLAAPGAREEPVTAIGAAAPELPPITAQSMVASLRLGERSEVDASQGAYRVLGWSGDQKKPEHVMVALALPVTTGGELQWLGFSVVLSWSADGWQLANAQPQDLGQDADAYDSAGALPREVASSVLAGPGWSTFANGE